MKRKGLAGLAFGILVAASAASAQGAKPWLHVQVDEGSKSKVAVNLPLSLVEIALAAAPQTLFSDGHFKLHTGDSRLSLADIRKLWKELKATGDSEFVSVEQEDETVSIARKGELVLIRVAKPSNQESVKVDLPVSLVDAMLAGEGDEIDVRAALADLSKRRGDIVHVTDANSQVHVWIDERN